MRGSLLNREPEVARVLRDDSHVLSLKDKPQARNSRKEYHPHHSTAKNICLSTVGRLDAHQSNPTCLRQVYGEMNGACGVAVTAIKPNGSAFPFSPRTDILGYFQIVPSGLDLKAG
jgi:hypothetical protein